MEAAFMPKVFMVRKKTITKTDIKKIFLLEIKGLSLIFYLFFL